MSEATVCIFCLKVPGDLEPWCKDNPGEGCTYGMYHEFPGSEYDPKAKKPTKQPAKKMDKQVCLKCGLHVRNPASQTNGCTHEYPEGG